jgi:hypothetical protein
MTSSKHQTFQDLYYDGKLDSEYDGFCEDTQSLVELRADYEYKDEAEYWDSLDTEDDYYIGLMSK